MSANVNTLLLERAYQYQIIYYTCLLNVLTRPFIRISTAMILTYNITPMYKAFYIATPLFKHVEVLVILVLMLGFIREGKLFS